MQHGRMSAAQRAGVFKSDRQSQGPWTAKHTYTLRHHVIKHSAPSLTYIAVRESINLHPRPQHTRYERTPAEKARRTPALPRTTKASDSPDEKQQAEIRDEEQVDADVHPKKLADNVVERHFERQHHDGVRKQQHHHQRPPLPNHTGRVER